MTGTELAPTVSSAAGRPAGAARRGFGTRLVGVVGELLVTLGVLVLLFLVWQLWWTDVTSDRAQAVTVSELSRDFATAPASPAPSAPETAASPLLAGEAFAVVRIPRLGADYARPVLEGSSADILAQGLGHYVGTAGPGEVGNFAVAGHRTTYGRPLQDIDRLRTGDRVLVETRAGWTVYAVTGHEIVLPQQSEVIAPVPGDRSATPTEPVLTFTSCHPKFGASHRYVVHADLVETRTRAQGPPDAAVSVGGR